MNDLDKRRKAKKEKKEKTIQEERIKNKRGGGKGDILLIVGVQRGKEEGYGRKGGRKGHEKNNTRNQRRVKKRPACRKLVLDCGGERVIGEKRTKPGGTRLEGEKKPEQLSAAMVRQGFPPEM